MRPFYRELCSQRISVKNRSRRKEGRSLTFRGHVLEGRSDTRKGEWHRKYASSDHFFLHFASIGEVDERCNFTEGKRTAFLRRWHFSNVLKCDENDAFFVGFQRLLSLLGVAKGTPDGAFSSRARAFQSPAIARRSARFVRSFGLPSTRTARRRSVRVESCAHDECTSGCRRTSFC